MSGSRVRDVTVRSSEPAGWRLKRQAHRRKTRSSSRRRPLPGQGASQRNWGEIGSTEAAQSTAREPAGAPATVTCWRRPGGESGTAVTGKCGLTAEAHQQKRTARRQMVRRRCVSLTGRLAAANFAFDPENETPLVDLQRCPGNLPVGLNGFVELYSGNQSIRITSSHAAMRATLNSLKSPKSLSLD
ncbi:unnamed protein product [Triticum turgidum subsp. durum]|uniref:Uncharacterized protein n=1 Tax=Triticum turgidum subsp. durum TaxID=4567 RepID=A0A9R0UXQ0_TRITD|nr:unnamed protein product [Triticum turgidum subsp. durum]